MATQEMCRVVGNREIGAGLFELTMEAPVLCMQAQPGQFVHITCGEGNLLRRPISICNVQDGQMIVVFQVKGDGTAWLSKDRYVGVSGMHVAPDLYLAAGISGQVQHTSGMSDSKVVVAVNSDANAPIFEVADYGIVGDLYDVLPAITAALS